MQDLLNVYILLIYKMDFNKSYTSPVCFVSNVKEKKKEKKGRQKIGRSWRQNGITNTTKKKMLCCRDEAEEKNDDEGWVFVKMKKIEKKRKRWTKRMEERK